MKKALRQQLLPILGALAVGGVAVLLLWWLQISTRVVSYDPAKHDRVRVITVDTAKQKECLDRFPGEQRASVGYLRCTEGYVYDRRDDVFIDKRPQPASP